MARVLFLFSFLALAGCSTLAEQRAEMPWPECAKAQAIAWLSGGIDPSWPQTQELPQDQSLQAVSLGTFPPDAIHDGYVRTLHLAPSLNAIYVEQTGGFAGVHQLFGPVSLVEHCRAAPPVRPNNSFKPKPLRGSA
jgi:hypothetical protein